MVRHRPQQPAQAMSHSFGRVVFLMAQQARRLVDPAECLADLRPEVGRRRQPPIEQLL
jgi:hypothetical protein